MSMALVAVNGGEAAGPPPPSLARYVQAKNEVLIDALPYLDKDYDDPAVRDAVDRMVEDEMDSFEPEDYIGTLPKVPEVSFQEGSLLKAEWERITQDPSSKINGFNQSKYAAPSPQGPNASKPEAWQQAIHAAQANLEHTVVRSANVELMQTYGVNAWRAYNSTLEDTNALYKNELDRKKTEIVDINRKRMAAQLTIEHKIQRLEDEYRQAVHKNLRLEAICFQMEKEKGGSQAQQ